MTPVLAWTRRTVHVPRLGAHGRRHRTVPDITISASQEGCYEVALPAGATVVVAVERRRTITPETVEVLNLGSDPLYVRGGDAIAPRDPFARTVGGGSGLADFPLQQANPALLALTCATDTTFSVARS